MHQNLLLGKAGELRVCSELLRRGENAYLTLADSGIDIVTESNIRLQVKTARANKLSPTKYCFSFQAWKKDRKKQKPHALEGVDYVVLWAVNCDVFLIIPAQIIKGKISIKISLPGRKTNKYNQYIDNWKPIVS